VNWEKNKKVRTFDVRTAMKCFFAFVVSLSYMTLDECFIRNRLLRTPRELIRSAPVPRGLQLSIPKKSYLKAEGEETSASDIEVTFEEFDQESDDDSLHAREYALALLDCMTTPLDPEDSNYDLEKDYRREQLLLTNDYQDLKVQLRSLGLRTTGDKAEMITRLLMHVIDPTLKYNALSGREPNLEYINQTDLTAGNLTMRTTEEMNVARERSSGPDADDMAVLRKRKGNKREGNRNAGDSEKLMQPGDKLLMDGLSRREIEFAPLNLIRDHRSALLEDKDRTIRAYVVGGKDVLKTWERNRNVVILLPDEYGWRSKPSRVFADEIAFYNQVIVMVPDVLAGSAFTNFDTDTEDSVSYSEWIDTRSRAVEKNRIFDDVVASLFYGKKQYDASTLSLVGLGVGGGIALDTASTLATIESMSGIQFSSPKESHKKSHSLDLDQGVEWDEFGEVVSVRGSKDEEMNEPNEFMEETDDLDENEKPKSQKPADQSTSDGISVSNYFQETQFTSSTFSSIVPKVLLAVTPCDYNLAEAAAKVRIPTLAIVSEYSNRTGASIKDAHMLYDGFMARSGEIEDFSFRIYEGTGQNIDTSGSEQLPEGYFAHNPRNKYDLKAAQEAISLGLIWVEVFSRPGSEYTDGRGETKNGDSGFTIVNQTDLGEPRPSPVATYLHDDPNLFLNTRLQNDEEVRESSHEN
jgi:hypothetical protein